MSEDNSTKVKSGSRGGLGISGLAGIIAGIYSAATTPVFVGAAGLGMAAVVGLATFAGGIVGGVVGVVGGLFAGAVVFGGLGMIAGARGLKIGLIAGAIGGAAVGGLGGTGYGIYKGYSLSQKAMEEKACAVPFNDAVAQRCRQMNLVAAPQVAPTPVPVPVAAPVR